MLDTSDHIQLSLGTVTPIVNAYTYPVFVRAKNDRPDLIASSVIIKVDGRNILVTASHVVINVLSVDSSFYIAVGKTYIALEDEFTFSSHDEIDHFDIAFVELSDEFVKENGVSVLDENMLMINKTFPSIHISLIHGYPRSKNKQVKALGGGTVFKSNAYSYAGYLDSHFQDWEKYGKDKVTHTCMRYGLIRDEKGHINLPTHPRGISGGGLWLMPDSFKARSVFLDSIFIEYHKKDKITFSTKIEWVVQFINENT